MVLMRQRPNAISFARTCVIGTSPLAVGSPRASAGHSARTSHSRLSRISAEIKSRYKMRVVCMGTMGLLRRRSKVPGARHLSHSSAWHPTMRKLYHIWDCAVGRQVGGYWAAARRAGRRANDGKKMVADGRARLVQRQETVGYLLGRDLVTRTPTPRGS